MNLYIYSDESGVFDKKHNDIFVFGGVILIGNEEKEILSRKYSKAEKDLRESKNVSKDYELKATHISNNDKNKLFRSLNNVYKFGVIIREKETLDTVSANKKSKQRFLDFAYKIAVKNALSSLIKNKTIIPDNINNLYFYVDEHTTATNGIYELKESLEQEFKYGTHNWKFSIYYPPILPKIDSVNVEFCNSANKLLVRSADIVANKIYYLATTNQQEKLKSINKLFITYLPK